MNEFDSTLLLLAQRYREREKKKGTIANWYGRRGGSVQRKYVCYVCDQVIDTESAKYPMTVHAESAIHEHGLKHLKEHNLLIFVG